MAGAGLLLGIRAATGALQGKQIAKEQQYQNSLRAYQLRRNDLEFAMQQGQLTRQNRLTDIQTSREQRALEKEAEQDAHRKWLQDRAATIDQKDPASLHGFLTDPQVLTHVLALKDGSAFTNFYRAVTQEQSSTSNLEYKKKVLDERQSYHDALVKNRDSAGLIAQAKSYRDAAKEARSNARQAYQYGKTNGDQTSVQQSEWLNTQADDYEQKAVQYENDASQIKTNRAPTETPTKGGPVAPLDPVKALAQKQGISEELAAQWIAKNKQTTARPKAGLVVPGGYAGQKQRAGFNQQDKRQQQGFENQKKLKGIPQARATGSGKDGEKPPKPPTRAQVNAAKVTMEEYRGLFEPSFVDKNGNVINKRQFDTFPLWRQRAARVKAENAREIIIAGGKKPPYGLTGPGKAKAKVATTRNDPRVQNLVAKWKKQGKSPSWIEGQLKQAELK